MISELIQSRTGINEKSIINVISLIEEGATIPFIARYRKERTGSLDEVQLDQIKQEFEHIQKLEKRKETVLQTIKDQGKLSPELESEINQCYDATTLEDLYLPYKKSRKTKADIAKENGLEGLAKFIAAQRRNDLQVEAKRYIRGSVGTVEEALEGARHIIAEWIHENSRMRNVVRTQFSKYAVLEAKVVAKKKEEAENYKDYFDFYETLNKCPSHRLLAIYRGDDAGLLKMKITIDEDRALDRFYNYYIKSNGPCAEQLEIAIKDGLKRLILPSIETEFKNKAKEKADKEAIAVFVTNLKQLLLEAPLGPHSVLTIDPGFRTGCKIAILDEHGSLLDHTTIYPHPPQSQLAESLITISSLMDRYAIKNIAIGNGTAGRETYQLLKDAKLDAELYMVNESGASIYSASAIARDEFPNLDLTVRGTVSIGRRLMDPLAELIKIDPKSIGVGQYQHDVHQGLLKENLDRAVESCVNTVGINLNTASEKLLQYVSGVGPSIAQNIVNFRNENGGFSSRLDLLKVPRMGKKAFEQAAGFLRVKNSDNPLDNTAVHPERYDLVKQMLSDHQINLSEITSEDEWIRQIDLNRYVNEEVGVPTLKDIIQELQKPGLDPRGRAQPVQFSATIKSIEDISLGMKITGVVSNITKFGAFVDIGIKDAALLHISQIVDRFIKDPAEVLSINQVVQATVIEVDIKRKRISLSTKEQK